MCGASLDGNEVGTLLMLVVMCPCSSDFHPSFVGLTGSDEQLRGITKVSTSFLAYFLLATLPHVVAYTPFLSLSLSSLFFYPSLSLFVSRFLFLLFPLSFFPNFFLSSNSAHLRNLSLNLSYFLFW